MSPSPAVFMHDNRHEATRVYQRFRSTFLKFSTWAQKRWIASLDADFGRVIRTRTGRRCRSSRRETTSNSLVSAHRLRGDQFDSAWRDLVLRKLCPWAEPIFSSETCCGTLGFGWDRKIVTKSPQNAYLCRIRILFGSSASNSSNYASKPVQSPTKHVHWFKMCLFFASLKSHR